MPQIYIEDYETSPTGKLIVASDSLIFETDNGNKFRVRFDSEGRSIRVSLTRAIGMDQMCIMPVASNVIEIQ